jgi:hypothetical protein
MAMPKRRFCASSRLWYSGFSASAKRRSAAARVVNASARSRRRSVASVRCPAARRASRCAILSLLTSRSACSTAGQFFSWAGVSFSAALIAAKRASVTACPLAVAEGAWIVLQDARQHGFGANGLKTLIVVVGPNGLVGKRLPRAIIPVPKRKKSDRRLFRD